MNKISRYPPFPCKGLVFDLDGTLLSSSHVVSDRLCMAIEDAVKSGVQIVLASARPPRSVLSIAEEIGLSGPMVALNGALVVDTKQTILAKSCMDDTAVAAVRKSVSQFNEMTAHYYRQFDWLVEMETESVRTETAILGYPPSGIIEGSDTCDISKMMIVGHGEDLSELEEIIRISQWNVSAIRSKPTYLEITSPGVTKASGLVRALNGREHLLQSFIAFGDGDNDVPLLQNCGFGIAMGNASSKLKAVADLTIGTNDDDAISDYLSSMLIGAA